MSEDKGKSQTETVTRVKKIERTPAGLVNAIFESIDSIRAREITPEECRAVSHSARTIVNVARLEMDYQRSLLDGKATALTSLPLHAKS